MTNCVLVVAAHTDDEALGCGGTIARHVAEGDSVIAIYMADGVTSRKQMNQDDLVKRESAAESAKRVLGIEKSYHLGLPDNRMDTIALLDIIQPLEKLVNEIKPSIVYTHHCGDLNVDHRITHNAVITACRPTPETSIREIYTFEVLSSTEWSTPGKNPFIPNYFVNITEYINSKLEAIKCYQLEMRQKPHARSIENINSLAIHRGCTVGCEYAEAFVLFRHVK